MPHRIRSSERTVPHRPRVLVPLALAVGLASSGLLGLSTTGTLSGFVATITNDTDTAGTGTLVMQESNSAGTVNCYSSGTSGGSTATNVATCSTINKYGGNLGLVPGGSTTTTINIKNSGTAAAGGFTLTPSGCTQTAAAQNGGATDLCSQLTVQVTSGGTTIVATKTLAAFNTAGALTLTAPAAGVTTPYTFVITAPAALNNTYQGISVSQPIAWSFTA